MLNLICGADENARNAALTQAVRAEVESGRRCFLLVPEQQAYISEKQFADALPPYAGRTFEILGFSRLADRVFRLRGGPEPASIKNATRSLLMWDTLRELAPTLRRYGATGKRDTALTAKLLKAVTELENSGVEGDALEKAAGALPADSALPDKLRDLSEIYAVFREKCRRATGPDPSERLSLLAEMFRAEPLPAEISVFVDSFTSFTYPEYGILRELLRGDRNVTVTLCLDRPFSHAPHFASVAETAQRLIRIAAEIGVTVRQTLLPAPSGIRPASLEVLANRLWDFSAKRPAPLPEDGSVTLLRASNRYEEAEACAHNILSLIRDGYRFGDIAVMVRDPEAWRGILDAALEKSGIPCFYSERIELAAKPLSRLILSAVRAAARGYRTQDIVTLVKTGLSGAELRDVAFFEEYCETWHITGKRFCDDVWEMNPDGLTDRLSPRAEEILAAANRVRTTVMPPLIALSEALKDSEKIADRCRALYTYLSDLCISDRLAEQARRELSLGQIKEAGESLRLYRFVTDCLGDLCELFPQTPCDTEEFLTLLTLFFADADLGSVPNRHDCVIVGSAATARFASVRAVLLLGVCEGELPRAIADDGILSDRDKGVLDALGIRFDTRAARQSAEELFYVRRAVSLPSDRLFLSCSAAEADGTTLTPSLAFTRTAYLLGLPVGEFVPPRSAEETAASAALRAKPLPGGTVLRLSQTSVQDFVLCPYRYYSTHILRLRGRKDSTVGAADEGTFLHFVFEQLLRRSLGEDGLLHLPAAEELDALTDRIVADYLARVCPIPPDRMDARLLHIFARLREHARLMLRDIADEIAGSRFIPSEFEQSIGGVGPDSLPEVSFALRDGGRVVLGGKVDRIDLWEHNGQVVVRVVDYKSGEHKFSLDEVRTGEDLQLVLYLFAACSADPQKRVAGGAEFLFATRSDRRTEIARSGFLSDDPSVCEAADGSSDGRFTKKLLRRTTEEMHDLFTEMQVAVCSVAERILSGEAHKTPSEKACRFCPVADCCDCAVRAKG